MWQVMQDAWAFLAMASAELIAIVAIRKARRNGKTERSRDGRRL